MPEPVSTALIGYGYWGPNLARNLYQNKLARLAVICDSSAERLADVPRLYPGVAAASDAEAVFNDPAIEAVVISTPVRSHYALARAALSHGKHVLVEKPIALSSTESSDLIAVAASSGRTLMVGHTFEYNPAVLKIKDLIEKDEIGQVYYIYKQSCKPGPCAARRECAVEHCPARCVYPPLLARYDATGSQRTGSDVSL